MKFLCDNCKAKYQIADEKVAGKTVRMKCRKCGHQIEVRAAVTETSVASSPPRAPSASEPPRAARAGLATSLSATKPRAPTPSTASGALAGAFQRQVEQAPSTQPFPQGSSIEVSVTDEWYVAINGVPVGPVRISELRRKAGSGAVTEDSLCWQEGLEEWRPVRSIPELAALVREAAQGNRVSLVSPPPNEGRQSSPPRPPAPPPPRPAQTSPLAPPLAPRPPAPMRSNVVPLHARVSAPEPHEASPMNGGAAALAVAPPTPAPMPVQAPPPPPPPAPVADPFAVPPAPPAATAPMHAPLLSSPSVLPPAPSMYPSEPKKGGVPLWFWPILVLFLGFGAVAAYALFFRQPQPPQQIVVQVPAPQAPTSPAASNKDDVPPPSTTDPATSSSTASTGQRVATGPRGGTAPTAKATGGGGGAADLSGLVGGGGGPVPGGGGPGGAGAGGGGLDQAAVERVVSSHRVGVRRVCWDSGNNDKKSSVNVTVNATVGPNGNVVGTSSTGDDPAVAKCIEGQVRGWMFPAPGENKQLVLPFHFVRS